MALQPFTNEQLNCCKFAFIVLNEIPKALRQTFKQMWDNTFASLPGFQPWDDSNAVRTLFLSTEGGTTKVPIHLSYDKWDCTALFQATIFAKSFALPDSRGHHRILHDLYLKSRKLPHGTFHSFVVSPSGDNAETFALAIDQLRLLRNSFCHSFSSEIDKKTFDQYIQHAKDAIKALGINTDPINAVGSLTESDFPTEKVQRLEDDIRKELQTESTFLKEEVKDELTEIRSDIAHLDQKRQEEAKLLQESHKEDTVELKTKIETANAASQEMMNEKFAEFQTESTVLREDVKDKLQLLQESHKKDTVDLKKAIETTNAASQEMMNEKLAEFQTESTVLREDVKDKLQLLQESHKKDTVDLKRTIETTNATSREMMNETFTEFQTESTVLMEDVKDELVGIRSDITQLNQKRKEEAKILQDSHREDTVDLKKTIAANQEMITEKFAELNQEIKDKLKEDSSGKQKIKASLFKGSFSKTNLTNRACCRTRAELEKIDL